MKKSLILFTVLALVFCLAACAEEPAAPLQMDVQQVYTQLGEALELPAMLTLNESLMLDLCGIQAADVKQTVVAICEDSLRTDETWIVEAVDEAAAKRIVELAQKRLKKKGEESITYSPEQYAVVEKAQLLQNGNYVILLVSPAVEDMAKTLQTLTGAEFNKVK